MSRFPLLAFSMFVIAAPALAQPAPVPPEGGGGEATVPAGNAGEGGEGYDVRLRSLREKVDDLKSRVFDSKTKLLLLREQILHNLISEARAVIRHVNDASSSLTLEEVLYHLDREKIYYQSNREGTLDENRDFTIFTGGIAPGNHLLQVEMLYRGNGKLFPYLSGYVFRVQSSFSFFAAKGQEAQVRVVGFEKGGMTTRLEDRPSVRFELEQKKVSADGKAVEDAAPATGDGK